MLELNPYRRDRSPIKKYSPGEVYLRWKVQGQPKHVVFLGSLNSLKVVVGGSVKRGNGAHGEVRPREEKSEAKSWGFSEGFEGFLTFAVGSGE